MTNILERPKMDPEIKRKWVAALRSGKYAQGQSLLENDNNNRFCCLGVLMDIQGFRPSDYYDRGLDPASSVVPPRCEAGLDQETMTELAMMNDGNGIAQRSFDHIAGFIDSAL